MLIEHDQGRANAHDYSELLRQHIDKEDNILYQMADQVLTPADQQELRAKFEEIERERIGAGKHDEYVKLIDDLERELGFS
jgi:hemerythrin-like domain-containing protein